MGGENESAALRAAVSGRVQGVGFREATVRRARSLGLAGWVRNAEDGTVRVHAEGPEAALASLLEFLAEGPRAAVVRGVETEPAKVEGHEQFAVRGVSAGAFVVDEHAAGRRFELRLEVGGRLRFWALSKAPSMDPAVKRLAIEIPAREPADRDASGRGGGDAGGASSWDRGTYEQGGRVPWPEALERGHAVFVLHGEKLRGGFALQRIRARAEPQWLLIKRRDEAARRGTLAESP